MSPLGFDFAGGAFICGFLLSGTRPIFLSDAVVRPQDVFELLSRSRLQIKRELNRIHVDLLERTEVAAVVDIPVLHVKVAFYLDLDANVTSIPDFYRERVNFIPAGNVAATVEYIVFRLKIH